MPVIASPLSYHIAVPINILWSETLENQDVVPKPLKISFVTSILSCGRRNMDETPATLVRLTRAKRLFHYWTHKLNKGATQDGGATEENSRPQRHGFPQADAIRGHSPEGLHGSIFPQGRLRSATGVLSRAALGACGAGHCRHRANRGAAHPLGAAFLRGAGQLPVRPRRSHPRRSRLRPPGHIL